MKNPAIHTKSRFVAFSLALVGIMNLTRIAKANELVFDNLQTRPNTRLFLYSDPGDLLLAQPFLLGTNTAISEVSLLLEREGDPDGPLHIEIWDDSGESMPASPIARIATLEDLNAIPISGRRLTFDTHVNGLDPKQPYYVVLSFEDADVQPGRSVGWGLVGPDEGTFGAGGAMSLGDFHEGQPTPRVWTPVADFAENTPFKGDANFFRMRVTAVPELAPFLQAGDADQDLDFDQLDLVKVQVAAKYLTGANATWGEGDWNGAPGGEKGNPPTGDGQFNQLDIVSALANNVYLAGPYGAMNGVSQNDAIGNLADELLDRPYQPTPRELNSLPMDLIEDEISSIAANRPVMNAGHLDVDVTPIPEPNSILLFFAALLCSIVFSRGHNVREQFSRR